MDIERRTALFAPTTAAGERVLLGRLLTAYKGGKTLLLLFDYDGTLVPIAEMPRRARLAGPTRRVLEWLSVRPRIFVGVLSGRQLQELRKFVGLAGLYYAGNNGMELDLHGRCVQHPRTGEAAALMRNAAGRLDPALAEYPGLWLERKQFGLTVHYRQVASDRTSEIEAAVEGLLQLLRRDVRIIRGPMALEIVPVFGWTKGDAVRKIAEHAGKAGTCVAFYAGDHDNDREAFLAVEELGGVTVRIGPPGLTREEHSLEDTRSLEALLLKLVYGLTQVNGGMAAEVVAERVANARRDEFAG